MDVPITVTRLDVERLRGILGQEASAAQHRVAEQLETELERARVVASHDVAPNVVTMNSTVVFEDDRGIRREVDLVYPQDAGPGRLSVLSPMGAALLGLAVGDEIEWPMPDGSTSVLKAVEVLYQPEDAGDLHL
jgi:regulator of nucleoside diphosphate kinase